MSSQTSHEEVQHALYGVLAPGGTVDATLASLGVVGVYDMRGVPQNKIFDYITIGDGYEIPNNTLGRRGYVCLYTIHIWSRQRGTQAASLMLSRMNQLIDQQSLSLSSQAHVSTMYDRANWMDDPDGLTLHVAARYRIYTEE